MRTVTTQGGFTLIEAIIYIGLFTLVVGGGILSTLQIFDGQADIQFKARKESEVNFAFRKIDWLINGANSGDILIGAGGKELIVTKDGKQYTLELDADGLLTMEEGGTTYDVTNYSVEISDIEFTKTTGNPDVLTINMTVDGEALEPITRYVRTE